MLYKSGHNLENEAINFTQRSNTLTLFSAYIKLPQLRKLNINSKIKEIVVRWDVQDLCLGISDIELYVYCKENGISLYRNTRIHLKAIWDNQDTVFLGSANITGRGIGEAGNYNFELNGIEQNLSIEDRLYFKSIINSSELVDDELYKKLNAIKNKYRSKKIKYPSLKTEVIEKDKFLLSQLPMSINPTSLLNGYFDQIKLSNEDKDFLVHDLSLYKIDLSLDRKNMEVLLKENFNTHPFIIALKDFIKNSENHSMRYGGIVNWIQSNTTTVPTPRSWELKKEKIVNILYDWICYFDDHFYWDRPNHSQVIYYKE